VVVVVTPADVVEVPLDVVLEDVVAAFVSDAAGNGLIASAIVVVGGGGDLRARGRGDGVSGRIVRSPRDANVVNGPERESDGAVDPAPDPGSSVRADTARRRGAAGARAPGTGTVAMLVR
jgi:hypothetical protein